MRSIGMSNPREREGLLVVRIPREVLLQSIVAKMDINVHVVSSETSTSGLFAALLELDIPPRWDGQCSPRHRFHGLQCITQRAAKESIVGVTLSHLFVCHNMVIDDLIYVAFHIATWNSLNFWELAQVQQ